MNTQAPGVNRPNSTHRAIAERIARKQFPLVQQKAYQEIIAEYNSDKDRVTIEVIFSKLVDVVNNLDAEQRRAVEEGLSEDELALFDLLNQDSITKQDRERLKEASKELLAELKRLIAPMEQWTEKEQTQASRR